MINDLRLQKRTISIELERDNYNFDLDRVVDMLLRDLEIICNEKITDEKIKINILVN